MKRRCEKTGKVQYVRHQDAEKVVGHLQKHAGDGVAQQPQSVYRCRHCSRWHLTSMTPEQSRAYRHSRRAQSAERAGGEGMGG